MTMLLARKLAIVFGVLVPGVEVVRRWHQLGDLEALPFWLDDFFIGGFLLLGAWKTGQDVDAGRPWLAAAIGFAAGMNYASFFSQLAALDAPDPSGLSGITVVAIKGVLEVLAIIGLFMVLRSDTRSQRATPPRVERGE
jgi:hypothetical protein